MTGLIMFAVALLLLLLGFPVAFTFGGVAVFFGLLAEGPGIFALMPHRIWSIMNNTILMAIPLFIFMGIVLQKSNLAERLLESMGFLFGEIRGGIAISTILVGAMKPPKSRQSSYEATMCMSPMMFSPSQVSTRTTRLSSSR